MNQEEIKKLLNKYVTSSGRLNANNTRKMSETDIKELHSLSEMTDVTITTHLHHLSTGKIKSCINCGKHLNVENFVAGWNQSKKFCSIRCKGDYNPELASGEVIKDFNILLDINGIPSQSKLDTYLNKESIEYLKNTVNKDIDDFYTLLWLHIKNEKLKYCITCNTPLKVDNFASGYRATQKYCSNTCCDKDEDRKKLLSSYRLGVSRYETPSWIENITIPWFEERTERLKREFKVSIQTDVNEYIKNKNEIPFQCDVCSHKFISHFGCGKSPKCPKCRNRSEPQIKICNFVESLGFSTVVNDRKVLGGKEIDIYIPEKNIGIEYDGFYWHSNITNVQKYKIADELGIRMIRVFEDELDYKQDIVYSRISAILGKTQNIFYGRNCSVIELDQQTTKEFLENNHIQGHTYGSVNLGLIHDNVLISVMSFTTPRFNKNFQYELLRFCSLINTSVVGGASKLFSYFVKKYNPSNVISYCDKRYGSGNVYTKLGFTYTHSSSPNYFYYKKKKRYSRIGFQKHKLDKILEKYDPALSETENVLNNGYYKIFDHGSMVFYWKK